MECSPSEWDCNTTPLLKINFQVIKRKAVQVEFGKWLQLLLEKQKEICRINEEGAWGRGVRFVEIMDSVFCISEIGLGFSHMIQVIIALPK